MGLLNWFLFKNMKNEMQKQVANDIIPVQTGIQCFHLYWIPTFVGM